MKYKHYAPNAPLYLVNGSKVFLQELAEEKQRDGLRVGILTTEEIAASTMRHFVLACGKRAELETVATALYDTLRAFNQVKGGHYF